MLKASIDLAISGIHFQPRKRPPTTALSIPCHFINGLWQLFLSAVLRKPETRHTTSSSMLTILIPNYIPFGTLLTSNL